MSASADNQPSPDAAKPTSRRPHWIWAAIYLVTIIVVAISEGKDIIRAISDADAAAGKFVDSISIYSLSEAFVDRFNACEYRYFVVCEPRAASVCEVFCGDTAGGLPMMAWTGL